MPSLVLQNAGCLEMLLRAEHTSPRVLKLLEGAKWVAVAEALGHLVRTNLASRAVALKHLGLSWHAQ